MAGDLKERLLALFQGLEEVCSGQLPGRDGSVTTGCRQLDRVTGGFHPGELTVIAGRPGVGKSGLLVAFTGAAHRNGYGAALLVPLQWGAGSAMVRLLAQAAGVGASRIATQTISDPEWPSVTRAAGVLVWGGELHLLDRLSGGMDTLRAEAGALAGDPGLCLVAVDHAGLVPGDEGACPCTALPGALAGLRRLARDLGVPVVTVVELLPGPETSEPGPPTPADLVARGVEPSAADDLWLVHAPPDPAGGPARLLEIRMSRIEGWQRSIRLLFDPDTFRFHQEPEIPELDATTH